jgi:hypothetical protein
LVLSAGGLRGDLVWGGLATDMGFVAESLDKVWVVQLEGRPLGADAG